MADSVTIEDLDALAAVAVALVIAGRHHPAEGG